MFSYDRDEYLNEFKKMFLKYKRIPDIADDKTKKKYLQKINFKKISSKKDTMP